MKFLYKVINHLKFRLRMFYQVYFWQIYYSFFLKGKVLNGPFTGMKYIRNSTGSVLLPKLIGTYESELYNTLTLAGFNNYDAVIDIGAAEGYYAVGILKYGKARKVVAFEMESSGRRKIKALARKNNVLTDDLIIEKRCEPGNLNKYLTRFPKSFLIVDIEGYEKELLDLNHSPLLEKCDILVELHHSRVPGIREIIANRFSQTHQVTEISQKERNINELQYKNKLIEDHFSLFSNEYRGNESWFILMAKNK